MQGWRQRQGGGTFNPQHLPPLCTCTKRKSWHLLTPWHGSLGALLGSPGKKGQIPSLPMAVKLCSLFTSVTEIRVSPFIYWLTEDYLTCHGTKRQPRDFHLPADPGWFTFCITRLVMQGCESSQWHITCCKWPHLPYQHQAKQSKVFPVRDLAYSYHNGST